MLFCTFSSLISSYIGGYIYCLLYLFLAFPSQGLEQNTVGSQPVSHAVVMLIHPRSLSQSNKVMWFQSILQTREWLTMRWHTLDFDLMIIISLEGIRSLLGALSSVPCSSKVIVIWLLPRQLLPTFKISVGNQRRNWFFNKFVSQRQVFDFYLEFKQGWSTFSRICEVNEMVASVWLQSLWGC